MEILMYANVAEDFETVAVVDWKRFFDEIVKQQPEDYIFILSPDEMKKFMELNSQITNPKGVRLHIDEAEYDEYPGVIGIAALGLKHDFVRKYKIGTLKDAILNQSCAVFYIDRTGDINDRAKAVLKRIKDAKSFKPRSDDRRN